MLLQLYKVLVCLLKFWLVCFTYLHLALWPTQVSSGVPAQEVFDVPLLSIFSMGFSFAGYLGILAGCISKPEHCRYV
jgi:hypothetical protein